MGWIADVTNPRVAIMVGGVATLAACLPLALRYRHGHSAQQTVAVQEEACDAQPGEVVDFAPGPIIDGRREQAPPPLRRARTA